MGISIRIILLIILSTTVLSAAAIQPQALGKGRMDQVINLETGVRTSALAPYFGSGGFVLPSTPQPMQISPSSMVYQSEKLRDESKGIFQETSDLLNQSQDLTKKVRDLEASARENALQSEQSAMLAKSELEETRLIYNETRAFAWKVETWARWQAYAPLTGVIQAGFWKENRPGELETLRGEVKALTDLIERLDMRIAKLENRTAAQ